MVRGGVQLREFLVTQGLHSLAGSLIVFAVLVVKEHRLSDLGQHPITILVLVELQIPCTVLLVNMTSAAFALFLLMGS